MIKNKGIKLRFKSDCDLNMRDEDSKLSQFVTLSGVNYVLGPTKYVILGSSVIFCIVHNRGWQLSDKSQSVLLNRVITGKLDCISISHLNYILF